MAESPEGSRGEAASPLVSVVLPTRNRAASLGRAVESVLRQTRGDWELLIVDDASEDETPDRIAAWAEDDPRIRGLRHERQGGGAAARNTGSRTARGRLIAFLDDDAEWAPHKLDLQVRRAEDRPDALVYGPVLAVGEGGASWLEGAPPEPDAPAAGLLSGNRIDTSVAMVARDPLLRCGGFDPALPRLQDWDLWLRLVPLVRLVHHDAVLARTFRTGERISTRPTGLPRAAERMAGKYPDSAELLATLGHMLLHEGHAEAGRRLLREAAARGGGDVGLSLRRGLAHVSPAAYAALARLSGSFQRRLGATSVRWPPDPGAGEAPPPAEPAPRSKP